MEPVAPVESARIDRVALLGVLWAGVAISFCFIVFRVYVRIRNFHRLYIDDAFVFLAWLMIVANVATWQWIISELYLSVGVASGQVPLTSLPAGFMSEAKKFLHGSLTSWIFYYTSLWSVKVSFLLFFRKLGNHIQSQRILWWCVTAFTMASYFVSSGLSGFKCLASHSKNQLAICLSASTAHFDYFALRFSTFLDIITDAMIIGVSANLLWKVKISLRKKLALVGICSLTAFVIITSITRVAVATSSPNLDLTWLILCGGIEASVAIVVACLGSFRTLYTRSERSNRHAEKSDNLTRPVDVGPNQYSNPLNTRTQYTTFITTGRPGERWSVEQSALPQSSQERILPLQGVHVRRDFTVLPHSPSQHSEGL